MKKYTLLFIVLLLSFFKASIAQDKTPLHGVIYHFTTSNSTQDLRTPDDDDVIINFKDYIIYRKTHLITYKASQTIVMDASGKVKDVVSDDAPQNRRIGTYYNYFIHKKGSKAGTYYIQGQPNGKIKEEIKTTDWFYKDNNYTTIKMFLDTVTNYECAIDSLQTIENKQYHYVVMPKLVNAHNSKDSILLYFSDKLTSIDFSFNTKFDKKYQSKLCKIKYITRSEQLEKLYQEKKITFNSMESHYSIEPYIINDSKEALQFLNKYINGNATNTAYHKQHKQIIE